MIFTASKVLAVCCLQRISSAKVAAGGFWVGFYMVFTRFSMVFTRCSLVFYMVFTWFSVALAGGLGFSLALVVLGGVLGLGFFSGVLVFLVWVFSGVFGILLFFVFFVNAFGLLCFFCFVKRFCCCFCAVFCSSCLSFLRCMVLFCFLIAIFQLIMTYVGWF